MLNERETARQEARAHFETIRRSIIEKTEQVLAAIAHHNEVRDKVEQKLDQLKISVTNLEKPAA